MKQRDFFINHLRLTLTNDATPITTKKSGLLFPKPLHLVMKNISRITVFCVLILATGTYATAKIDPQAKIHLEQLEVSRGVCAVLGLPQDKESDYLLDLARESELTIYFQSPDNLELISLREAADKADLLGRRIFVEKGDWKKIHLASNLADAFGGRPFG